MTADARQDLTHQYGAGEKLKLFFPCVRQNFFPKRNLFAGPFAGEFGFELMQWQGFVRARRRHYDQVHVLTYPGRDYLYDSCRVHHHDIDLKNAGYWYGRFGPEEMQKMADAKAAEIGLKDYDVFNPSLLCTRYHKIIFWKQDFRLFEEPPLSAKPYDVLFHFRAVWKEGPDHEKNYSPEMADELVRRCLDRGLSVACYGHPSYAYCPRDCADLRQTDLRQSVAAISSARLAVGENSGGTHLANACGKPTVIWSRGPEPVRFSLLWNPFRVPIYVMTTETWKPAPEDVCRYLMQSLEDLRARTENFTKPCYTLPAGPVGNI
jgi:ADP-heptose:LPS heptosyltransferase